jgi:hypothetical protein
MAYCMASSMASRKKVMANLILIMSKVMATALSMAVSTKEGDGGRLKHGRRKPSARPYRPKKAKASSMAKEGDSKPHIDHVQNYSLGHGLEHGFSAKQGAGDGLEHGLSSKKSCG